MKDAKYMKKDINSHHCSEKSSELQDDCSNQVVFLGQTSCNFFLFYLSITALPVLYCTVLGTRIIRQGAKPESSGKYLFGLQGGCCVQLSCFLREAEVQNHQRREIPRSFGASFLVHISFCRSTHND